MMVFFSSIPYVEPQPLGIKIFFLIICWTKAHFHEQPLRLENVYFFCLKVDIFDTVLLRVYFFLFADDCFSRQVKNTQFNNNNKIWIANFAEIVASISCIFLVF